MADARRYYPSPVTVIAIDADGGQMDCFDDDPRHIWVSVMGWSHRRAIKTHAAPFMAAAETDDIYSLEGRNFMARLDLSNPPPFEHEGGERLEWPELTLGELHSQVREELGLPSREKTVHQVEFDMDAASAGLRAFLGSLQQYSAEDVTQVVVKTPGLWWRVSGAQYDGDEVMLTVEEDLPFDREPICPCLGEHSEDCPQTFKDVDAEFVTRYCLADAACTAAEEDLDITFTEGWPEEKFLRYDKETAQLLVHGDGEVRPYQPTQDEALLYCWRVIEKD